MDESKLKVSRRKFIAGTAAGVALAALPDWFTKEAEASNPVIRKKFGPNDQINIGVIGPGGSRGGYKMGLGDAHAAASKPGVKIVAVCDVDSVHLDEASQNFGGCDKYKDFRDLLGRKDIDAVIIGTPDHWHTFMCIAAMKAGKDVYCEKPLTLTIDEGKKLVKVWKETGAVFQTGSQQRSDGRFRLACQLVRNGRIGKVTKVEARLPTGPTGGPFAAGPVPEGFDWDMWLGQAPATDYIKERTHGNFRWWLEYSGGMLTDWGAHHCDIAQWGLGMDRSGPISVQSHGKGPIIGCDCYNTYPEFDVIFTYANGVPLTVTNQRENGVMFEGEGGWIFVSRGKIDASDKRLIEEPLPANAEKLYESNDHMLDFIQCMRDRKQPICDAEIGHRSVTVCHLANISLKLGGRKLEWDPKTEAFKNDAEANSLLKREARKQWRV